MNMAASIHIELPDEAATSAFGTALAQAISHAVAGGLITLQGDLGAGKTSLARSLIQSLGHKGRVVSPTYTLLEPYPLADRTIYHLDLYRLNDPEELALLGVRDIDTQHDLILVEWPERGLEALPKVDLALSLGDSEAGPGRLLSIEAGSPIGRQWLDEVLPAFSVGSSQSQA